jgi:hypothetical protein
MSAPRRSALLVPAALALACGSGSGTSSGESSGESTGMSSSDSTTTSSTPTTSTTATTTFTTTSTDESSSTGFEPSGPPCSVQYVTHDVLVDPLARGDQPGQFPTPIADVLEDNCGCHTLENGEQNVEWTSFHAPGGSLFLQHADLSRAFESGTLGQAIETQVRGYTMPVGSCPHPSIIMEVLIPWFDQGMPDGASYVPQ